MQEEREGEERAWVRAEALSASGSSEEFEIVSCNNGGVVVAIDALVGFVPCSLLPLHLRPLSLVAWAGVRGLSVEAEEAVAQYKQDRAKELAALVGQVSG